MFDFKRLPILETERLRLEPLVPSDADHLFPIMGDPEVMAYWDVPEVDDPDLVAQIVRSQVDAMAAGRDGVAAQLAARALELGDVAKDNDAEVRGAKPLREQTVNRAFSRRFFEAMQNGGRLDAGDDVDIDDAQIIAEGEAGEELLDDEDLIPG